MPQFRIPIVKVANVYNDITHPVSKSHPGFGPVLVEALGFPRMGGGVATCGWLWLYAGGVEMQLTGEAEVWRRIEIRLDWAWKDQLRRWWGVMFVWVNSIS
jgi:hypothetical protein